MAQYLPHVIQKTRIPSPGNDSYRFQENDFRRESRRGGQKIAQGATLGYLLPLRWSLVRNFIFLKTIAQPVYGWGRGRNNGISPVYRASLAL